jgi:subtilisin
LIVMKDPPTVFDEIFAKLTPDRLLHDPRATGEGVAVAVLDSGVERAVLEERAKQRGQPVLPIEGALFRPTSPAPLPYDGHQSSPHGTTVADIILTVAPRVKLYSADVFGPQGTCEVETVVAALRHAIDVWNVKVVNLSLGVPEHKLQQAPRRLLLQRAIEEAYFRDVLVFAAAHNEHPLTRSYPAAFAPPLISVDKALFDDPLRFAYVLKDQVEFQAHSRGYLGPFAREPATSWATPHLAGIAARILSLKPDLKPFEIKTILYWMFRAEDRPKSA